MTRALPASFEIAERRVGDDAPCFVIAEVAQAHDGSLGAAHAYIDAAARAGADAVKFQTHIASAESSAQEPFRARVFVQDATRRDYWERTGFEASEWEGLAKHAREAGLVFLSSPFSHEACELLQSLGVPAWKVPSGEIGNLPLLEHMARTRLPLLLSTGLATLDEVEQASAIARAHGTALGLFQCTTAYPCPPERLGLDAISMLRQRFHCPVGLSDHSGTIYAGIAARTLGAAMLEVHVTLSRECFGPDVPASVTTSELRSLVEGIRFVERALASPVLKGELSDEELELKRIFGRSVFVARDLPEGHRLEAPDLELRKPGGGFPAARLADLPGRLLRRAVRAGRMLDEEDLT